MICIIYLFCPVDEKKVIFTLLCSVFSQVKLSIFLRKIIDQSRDNSSYIARDITMLLEDDLRTLHILCTIHCE